MTPQVSIIMGSTSDLPVMKKAADLLNEFQVPFEMFALSAHRTPKEVEAFATGAAERGIKVIIAGAGMAAHLAGVVAASTPVPVIGVPLTGSLEGLDALLAMGRTSPRRLSRPTRSWPSSSTTTSVTDPFVYHSLIPVRLCITMFEEEPPNAGSAMSSWVAGIPFGCSR